MLEFKLEEEINGEFFVGEIIEIILDDGELKDEEVFVESDEGVVDGVGDEQELKIEIFVVVFVDVMNFLKLSVDDSKLLFKEKVEVGIQLKV